MNVVMEPIGKSARNESHYRANQGSQYVCVYAYYDDQYEYAHCIRFVYYVLLSVASGLLYSDTVPLTVTILVCLICKLGTMMELDTLQKSDLKEPTYHIPDTADYEDLDPSEYSELTTVRH